MLTESELKPEKLIGRAPDRLTLAEREALVGRYIAMEIYTPENLALQTIEAVGDTVQDCVAMLRQRGRDPLAHEFIRLNPPY